MASGYLWREDAVKHGLVETLAHGEDVFCSVAGAKGNFIWSCSHNGSWCGSERQFLDNDSHVHTVFLVESNMIKLGVAVIGAPDCSRYSQLSHT